MRLEAASGDINAVLASLVTSFFSLTSDDELDAFRMKVNTQLSVQGAAYCFSDFHSFMDRLSQKQDTVRFWYQFVSIDIFAYLGLFVGLRYHNWDLRTTANPDTHLRSPYLAKATTRSPSTRLI